MDLVDLVAFKRDYHNPALKAREVAQLHGIPAGELARWAKNHNIPTRKAVGIRAETSRHPKAGIPGAHGCNPSCPAWESCCKKSSLEVLPCEVYQYLDEDPDLVDREPAYSGSGVALSMPLYFLEDEL